MFPSMDTDVIEAVLRSNDGAVDDTIDQLLTMSIDADDKDFVDIPPELISPVCTYNIGFINYNIGFINYRQH